MFAVIRRYLTTGLLSFVLVVQPVPWGPQAPAQAGLLTRAVATGAVYVSAALVRRALMHATFAGRELARRKLYEVLARAPELAPQAIRMLEGLLKSPKVQGRLAGPNGARFLQEELGPMLSKLKAWNRPEVADGKLGNIVKQLFRDNARIGNGTTADAVRHELETGLRVGGKTHSEKAQTAIESLTRRLTDPSVSQADKTIAKVLREDLGNALRGR
jgi:hypothetical protein